MGQTVSGGHVRGLKKSGASSSCQSLWPPTCSKESVGRFLQGCWESQRRPENIHQGEYYDHIGGISYLIHRKCGNGEYSEVLEASRLNSTGRVEGYAIKIYRTRSLERQKQMKQELAIMSKLGTYCGQIVRLHQHSESVDDETGLMEMKLVLDLCSGGTLRQRMKKQSTMNEKAVRIIALQITQALHFLHTRRVMHCDVKPENILFVDPMGLNVKLSDFGIAKTSSDGIAPPRCTSFNTSDIYLAPEVFSEKSYGTPADMWSLGVTVYHCLTGRLPFQTGTTLKMEVCREITTGSFLRAALSNENFPESISFDALRFLDRLLRVDPNERLNVIEALNHRWLRGTQTGSASNTSSSITTGQHMNGAFENDNFGLDHLGRCTTRSISTADVSRCSTSTSYSRIQTTTPFTTLQKEKIDSRSSSVARYGLGNNINHYMTPSSLPTAGRQTSENFPNGYERRDRLSASALPFEHSSIPVLSKVPSQILPGHHYIT